MRWLCDNRVTIGTSYKIECWHVSDVKKKQFFLPVSILYSVCSLHLYSSLFDCSFQTHLGSLYNLFSSTMWMLSSKIHQTKLKLHVSNIFDKPDMWYFQYKIHLACHLDWQASSCYILPYQAILLQYAWFYFIQEHVTVSVTTVIVVKCRQPL